MKKTYLFLFLTILFVLLLLLLTFFYKNLSKKYGNSDVAVTESSAQSNNTESEDASTLSSTDFTFYDSEGTQVQLSDFYGSPIVLNFWASWCGPCKSEMGYFQEVYEELQSSGNEKNITILMVNLADGKKETVDDGKSYVAKQGYTFPLYFDSDLNGSTAYDLMYIPTTYFINSDQTILTSASGAIDLDTLNENIQKLQ